MAQCRRYTPVALFALSGVACAWLLIIVEAPWERVPLSSAQAQVIRPARSSRSAGKSFSNGPNETPPYKHIELLDEIWQLITLDRHRIGYSRTRFERLTEGNRLTIRTTTETHLAVKRFGQTTRMQAFVRTRETPQGDLVSFETRSGSGRQSSRMTGRRVGNYLLVETTANGTTSRRYHEWRPGIKSPTYPDRLLRTTPLKPGETRTYKTFLPDLGRITEVRLVALDYHPRQLHDGTVRKLLRVRVIQSVSPTEVVDTYLDEQGRPVESESEFIGKRMSQYIVPRAVALRSLQGEKWDLGLRSLIRTAPLREARKRNRIVYRIVMDGDDPARYVAADDRQSVRRIDGNTIDLTVTRSALPTRLVHRRTKEEYLSASRFLDATDVQVREHARRAAGYQRDEVQIALRMEKYVHEKLTRKNFSTAMATASQVARGLSGDCTEHAVLLAAMLRVRRVPSRIAVGLVYDERLVAFVSHMWTEALLGEKWVSFDATRGVGSVGPDYIKLADASFADDSAAPVTIFVPLMNVLGKWRIEIRDAGVLPGRGNRRIPEPLQRFRPPR